MSGRVAVRIADNRFWSGTCVLSLPGSKLHGNLAFCLAGVLRLYVGQIHLRLSRCTCQNFALCSRLSMPGRVAVRFADNRFWPGTCVLSFSRSKLPEMSQQFWPSICVCTLAKLVFDFPDVLVRISLCPNVVLHSERWLAKNFKKDLHKKWIPLDKNASKDGFGQQKRVKT